MEENQKVAPYYYKQRFSTPKKVRGGEEGGQRVPGQIPARYPSFTDNKMPYSWTNDARFIIFI